MLVVVLCLADLCGESGRFLHTPQVVRPSRPERFCGLSGRLPDIRPVLYSFRFTGLWILLAAAMRLMMIFWGCVSGREGIYEICPYPPAGFSWTVFRPLSGGDRPAVLEAQGDMV